ECRFGQRAVLRPQRGLADIAGEHVRATDGLALALEGARDAVLEQALAQSDARLARDDLHQIARLRRRRARDQPAQPLALRVRAAERGDLLEGGLDVGQRERLALARRLADQLVRDVTEVGVTLVARRHVPAVFAGPLEQNVG